jgi:hypothetical protein
VCVCVCVCVRVRECVQVCVLCGLTEREGIVRMSQVGGGGGLVHLQHDLVLALCLEIVLVVCVSIAVVHKNMERMLKNLIGKLGRICEVLGSRFSTPGRDLSSALGTGENQECNNGRH